MISHKSNVFGSIFERGTKLRIVKICSYFTIVLHVLLAMHIPCQAMHAVRNVTYTDSKSVQPSHSKPVHKTSEIGNQNDNGPHVPFVSSWRTHYPDTNSVTAQPQLHQLIGNRYNDSLIRRRIGNQLYSRTGSLIGRQEQPKEPNPFGSWWSTGTTTGGGENAQFDASAFVISHAEAYSPTTEYRLLNTKRPRQPRIQPFHAPFSREESKSRGWWSISSEKEKDISRFVMSLLSRYTVPIDPLQVYSIIYQWESYQHQKQLAAHRQWTQKLRQQKRRRRKLKEYNRHLRYFASVLTQKHMSQLRNARNFSEFKQILFQQASAKSAPHTADPESAELPPNSLIGPPIHYPVPGQNIVAASSSALQFPGGAGGGIVVNSLRSTRKASNRESRAIFDPPEPLELTSVKSNLIDPTAVQLNESNSEDHGTTSFYDQEEEEPVYSEAELRSAFESYQEFRQTACQPRNQILCVRSLLDLHQEHTAVVIPRGFHVRRCGAQIQSVCRYHNSPVQTDVDGEDADVDLLGTVSGTVDSAELFTSYPSARSQFGEPEHVDFFMDRSRTSSCECETAEEECLPTNVTLRTQAVAISRILPLQNLKHSTELIVVTDHVSCGCQPRCKNRRCISPLKLVIHTFSDCACVCPPNDVRCRQLLEGFEQFSMDEIPLPLNGSYILPPCRHGPMDDEHLYHRRCPRPVRRQISRK